MQDLIVVKQLPQIEEHLKELSLEVEQKVENAKSLVCTEENVTTIKQIRASLNKEFKEVENQRKIVKEQILAPYMQFEEIYKMYISDKYKSADNDLKEKIEKHVYSKVDMTYYEKYEDDNIISLMFYVNKKKKFSNSMELEGYTITYDKHTGERVPMSRYLNINLEQLQDALNNSQAYAVDGLDNGVNLSKRIPYVSHNYFICHDGSIGLLYQAGDLMEVEAGACKIVVSPETIAKVNELNKANE